MKSTPITMSVVFTEARACLFPALPARRWVRFEKRVCWNATRTRSPGCATTHHLGLTAPLVGLPSISSETAGVWIL